MNAKEFEKYWEQEYQNVLPLGYILRVDFCKDRWFRIHSLPESKRYADTNDEMQLILERQNTLITDIIGKAKDYILLFSAFNIGGLGSFSSLVEIQGMKEIAILNPISLCEHIPEDYDENDFLACAFLNQKWEPHSIDKLLEKVANEEHVMDFDNLNEEDLANNIYSMLLVDVNKNRIIAPYDGGVDIILPTQKERDFYKNKYQNWLSYTDSGL